MKCLTIAAFAAALTASPALADPHRDEGGHGYHRHYNGSKHKQSYWDGHCWVEQKWGKHGRYQEKRKCPPPRHATYARPVHPAPAVQPSPRVIIQPPPILIW